MKNTIIFIVLSFIPSLVVAADNIVTMDPNQIQINSHVHKALPQSLLPRIKATTDVFEIVDGITYEKAVDLYKRDANPEENLVIWEEMAKVYKGFCKSRCTTHAERMDVYRALLLRSMFPSEEAIKRLQTKVITEKEAIYLMSQYKLKAEPISVIQK